MKLLLVKILIFLSIFLEINNKFVNANDWQFILGQYLESLTLLVIRPDQLVFVDSPDNNSNPEQVQIALQQMLLHNGITPAEKCGEDVITVEFGLKKVCGIPNDSYRKGKYGTVLYGDLDERFKLIYNQGGASRSARSEASENTLLKLCNDNDASINVALTFTLHKIVTMGWYKVESQACKSVALGRYEGEIFYYSPAKLDFAHNTSRRVFCVNTKDNFKISESSCRGKNLQLVHMNSIRIKIGNITTVRF